MTSEVNLISVTHPNEEYTGCKTAQELIGWCARVSNPANQQKHGTAPKLIQSLLRDKHWSPLEMVDVSVEIKTTRDIARQILRHRSFSFQEYSQRYADPTKDLGFVTREARLQDKKNRQASIELTSDEDGVAGEWQAMQEQVLDATRVAYKWAIDNGIAKEQARAVLPEGLTESVIIMKGSVRSWVHYCDLRMKWDTQKEHRIVAEQCWEIIESQFPDIKIALDNIKEWEEFQKKLP
jgi:thymidylate synthase (FAD)